jgi:hypothetical protein
MRRRFITRMRLRWLLRAAAARRIRVFTLAVIVTFAFLIFPSWNTWNVYRASEEVFGQELRLERLIGTVIHLDEALTMSARMAAITGDTRWEERYRYYEPKLDAAIENVIQLSAGAYAAAAERTAAASRNLLAIENRALALTRQGRLAEAHLCEEQGGLLRRHTGAHRCDRRPHSAKRRTVGTPGPRSRRTHARQRRSVVAGVGRRRRPDLATPDRAPEGG